MNQLQRDKRAIRQVLPTDGSRMSVAEVYLRAGENLGRAIREMIDEGEIVRTEHGGRGYLALTVSRISPI